MTITSSICCQYPSPDLQKLYLSSITFLGYRLICINISLEMLMFATDNSLYSQKHMFPPRSAFIFNRNDFFLAKVSPRAMSSDIVRHFSISCTTQCNENLKNHTFKLILPFSLLLFFVMAKKQYLKLS